MAIPFNYKTTDDEELNSLKTEIAASFAQAQASGGSLANVLATDGDFTIDNETSIIVLDTATGDVTGTLPETSDDRQVVIMNRSDYAVKLKSADAKQVFPDLEAGQTATVAAAKSVWFSSTGGAK